MRKAKKENIIEAITIGEEELTISHPQFADDIVIFCEPSLDNLFNAKHI